MDRKPSFVYIVELVGTKYIKIGMAYDVQSRLSELQTANPGELKLKYTIKCASREECHELEKLFHSLYQQYRTKGEWFALPVDQTIGEFERASKLLQFVSKSQIEAMRHNIDMQPVPPVGLVATVELAEELIAKLSGRVKGALIVLVASAILTLSGSLDITGAVAEKSFPLMWMSEIAFALGSLMTAVSVWQILQITNSDET